jgi:hypothetical protein
MRCAITGSVLLLTTASCYAEVDYARDVQPIFASRCYGCHGPQRALGGLRLDDASRAAAAKDKLIARVTSPDQSFRMPLGGNALTPGQIATLKAWNTETQAGRPPGYGSVPDVVPTHWSFQPIHLPDPPKVRNAIWPHNAIDRFILARLEKEHLAPSPAADRHTLIRRVSLDITGLPPTPEEVAAFVADKRPNAYEHLVDRLLASPHYGEKWARTWLDLAHYADSDGYEKDLVRPWAWRYRQWVIEALNRDMPFDEFTVEQLAGDLLPNATVNQQVATGFLRNTLTNREAGVDRTEARFEQIINRTNTVGTVWLGLTVGCAQCHNHKFDPIPQKDYYRLFAFMDSTEESEVEAPLPGEMDRYLSAKPEYDRQRAAILAECHVPELQAKWEPRIQQAFKEQGKDLEWDFAVTEFRAAFDGADKFLRGYWTNRTARQADNLTDYFVAHRGPDNERDKQLSELFTKARGKLAALKRTLPELALAPAIRTDPVAVETHLHVGGDYQALGEAVEPGTLSVLPTMPPVEKPDRLALARWIVSRDNPLTACVAVNRMWQEFFGRGLVRSSDDFGKQGELPSHPELLDWLAHEFETRGWSMKQMHKLIVMSAAYRQSSKVRKDLDARDPDNALVARQSRLRLPAELVRDEALSVSGLLNPAIGGKSVRPPQPAGIAELGYSNNVKWFESTGPDRYRRGMYIHFQRTTPYPMLMNFDEPDSNTSCTRRRRSNTPLQSLNLLNDPVFFEAAKALAARVEQRVGQVSRPPVYGSVPDVPGARSAAASAIDYAFELCLARRPTVHERTILTQHYERQGALAVARVLLNLDEFITRE